ncbi:hypothetical protein JHK82_043891 [Glycine max]|nr:hypothetical protein JHK82_043891 [Glycine max]
MNACFDLKNLTLGVKGFPMCGLYLTQHEKHYWSDYEKWTPKSIWVAMIWSIWKHRNGVVFNIKSSDLLSLVDHIKLFSWSWLKGKEQNFLCSFHDWESNPLLCISSLSKSPRRPLICAKN